MLLPDVSRLNLCSAPLFRKSGAGTTRLAFPGVVEYVVIAPFSLIATEDLITSTKENRSRYMVF